MASYTWLALVAACVALAAGASAETDFAGKISRASLDRYLSRSITMMDLCTGRTDPTDSIRMLRNIGARFAGRTLYTWGSEGSLPGRVETARGIAATIHKQMPDMILQGGIFEIVTTDLAKVKVPAWAFEEYGLPVEDRPFNYQAMLFPDGRFVNHWSNGASVPDITRMETRLWFYTQARWFVDAGMEAIHWGQVALIASEDKELAMWRDTLTRARKCARQHARRHILLCDAHVPDGGPVINGKLVFDFHSFPLRIKEVDGKPMEGLLEVGYHDSIFRRSKGGTAPSGWKCDSLPYLAEFDNWGYEGKGGQPGGGWWTWGYDEICWLAHQPTAYANQWLRYAHGWLKEHDPVGHLQMPGSRCLAAPVGKVGWYDANTRSAACPDGFGQEQTIKEIWAAAGK